MLSQRDKDKDPGSFRSPKPEAKSAVFEPEVHSEHYSEYFDEEPEHNENFAAENEKAAAYSNPQNTYTVEFKFFVFLRYLLTHILFNIVGPAIVIFSPIFGYKNLRNQRFFDWSHFSRIQAGHYFAYTVFWVLWAILPHKGIYDVEIYMLVNSIMFRNISIALKYAYASENFLKRMKYDDMSVKDSYAEQSIPSWKDQKNDIIHKELQTAILSLDIESSLFFFEFLGKPVNLDSLNNLKKKYTYDDFISLKGVIEDTKENLIITSSPKATPFAKNSNREMSLSSKHVLDDFQAFLAQKKFDTKKLNGYNLTYELIKYSNKKLIPKLPIVLGFSLIRALLPIVYRTISGDVLESPALEYAILPLQTILWMTNYLTITISVGDLERKMHSLSQLGNLISPRKVTSDRKIFPTMNIFDPVTLHTWENVRKAIDRYGHRFILRNSLVIAFMAAFYGIVLLTLIVSIFGFGNRRQYDQVTIILLAYETFCYFALLFRMLVGGAFVNDLFKVHRGILTDIRRVMTNLRRFENHILGKYPIKLDNKIYIEGMKILKEELGEENFQEKMKERMNLLCETLDDMIRNLKYEETYNPYKVLGIPINYGILKSIIAGLISLGFAVYQAYS